MKTYLSTQIRPLQPLQRMVLRRVAAVLLISTTALQSAGQQAESRRALTLNDRPFSEQVDDATDKANADIHKRNTVHQPNLWDQLGDANAVKLPVPGAAATRRFPPVNLEFEAPGQPWVEVNVVEERTLVRLGYVVPVLNRSALLIAERIGVDLNLDNKQVLEYHKQQIRSRGPDAKFFNERDEAAGDFEGMRCEALATIDGQRMVHYVIWVAMRNGYAYQLITSGSPEDAASVDHNSLEFRRRLKLIEPKDIAYSERGKVVAKFKSSAFGYELDLSGLGWLQTGDEPSKLPEADFAAVHTGPSGMFVIAVPLPKRKPDLEALTNAMIDDLGFVGEGDEILRTSDCRVDGMTGQEVEARRVRGEHHIRYLMRIVSDDRCAYMVGGWTKEESDRLPFVKQSLGRFELSKNRTPNEAKLSAEQRACCGKVLNNLGLISYSGGDHLAALDYFTSARKFAPSEAIMAINCASVLSELNRPGEGIAVLNEYTKQHTGSPQLLALHARLVVENGDAENARKMYKDVFRLGYTDETALIQYIKLAIEANEFDEAIAVVEAVLQRKPTLHVQRFHAELYGMKGDAQKSVEMFESLRKRYPADQGVLFDLATAYERAGEYGKAIEITQQLVDSGRQDEPTLIVHGRMQLHLERFAQAKQTFERAAKLYPHSEAVNEFLKLASSQLGQGDNSLLKSPIEPVAIPAVVRQSVEKVSDDSHADEEKYGAVEISRVIGIHFNVGEPLRFTTSRKVKVYTSSGVARFNNLKFTFDPTSERLYVNRLFVFDEKGRQVAEGSVDNYYIVDDSDSGVASHAKIVNVPVPGLKAGYTLEWTVTREELASAEKFSFQEVIMASTTPVGVSAFYVRGDVQRLKWKSSMPMKVQVKDDVLLCVERNPTLFEYEAVQPSLEKFMPILWVGDASASWADEGDAYLSAIEDKLTVDAKTREFAGELTRNCRDDQERLSVIASHVQEGYRYQAIEFGRRARIPNSSSRSLELKYGDCKDHALLMRQLLTAVGIESHLVLVKSSGFLVDELPSLDQFNHMVVYVPPTSIGDPGDSTGLIVDATQKDADILLTPPYLMGGKSIFVLDPKHPRVVQIPNYPEDAGRITCKRQINIRENHSGGGELDAEIEEQVTFNDYVAPAIRSYLKQFEPERRREAVQALLSQRSQVHVKRLDVVNLDQPSKPLQLSLTYVSPGAFHTVASENDRSIVGKLPCPWEYEYMEAEYVDSRATPFEITLPMRVQSSVQVILPPGYQLAGLDESTGEMKTKFATWSCHAMQDQSTIQVEYELHLAPGRHPADAYRQYYSTMRDSLSALGARVTLRERATANARRPVSTRSTK